MNDNSGPLNLARDAGTVGHVARNLAAPRNPFKAPQGIVRQRRNVFSECFANGDMLRRSGDLLDHLTNSLCRGGPFDGNSTMADWGR